MNRALNCSEAEPLLSEALEGELDDAVRAELRAHVTSCPSCRELRDALAEVVAALREYPEVAPSAGLADRVAAASFRQARGRGLHPTAAGRTAHWPAWAQPLAAGLALVAVGGFLLTSRSEAPARAAARIADTTVDTGVFLTERKDRLVEDVRVLRVVIQSSFEGPLERVNERVLDYRRQLERRRSGRPADHEEKSSRGIPGFSNPAPARAVMPS